MLFDYVERIWLDNDGLYLVNGCVNCGRAERGHGWYSFCSTKFYEEPDNTTRLNRIKINRKRRQKQ